MLHPAEKLSTCAWLAILIIEALTTSQDTHEGAF